MKDQDIARIYFIVLLLIAGVFLFIFASTFIHAVIFAFILGGILLPYNERIYQKFHLPRLLTAVLISCVFFILLLIPFVTIIYQASLESDYIYNTFSKYLNIINGQENYQQLIGKYVNFLNSLSISASYDDTYNLLEKIIIELRNKLVIYIQYFANNLFNFIGQFCLMLLMIIGILTHAFKIKSYFMSLFPLNKHQDVQVLIEKFNLMNRSTLIFNSFSGIAQGTILGIMLLIFQSETKLFWGLLIGVSALIPVVGSLVITIPLGVYYYMNEFHISAIVYVVIATVVYLLIENLYKPILMGKGTQINPLLMTLSIIGGVTTFGLLGIWYGPLVLGVFLTLVEIFKSQIIIKNEQES